VIEPHGLSLADIGKLGKVRGARDVLAVDGAAIEVGGRQVNVIGVDPQQFRSWTPLATASDTRLWEAIAAGTSSPRAARASCCGCTAAPGISWRASPASP
jgi:hypothetical protein